MSDINNEQWRTREHLHRCPACLRHKDCGGTRNHPCGTAAIAAAREAAYEACRYFDELYLASAEERAKGRRFTSAGTQPRDLAKRLESIITRHGVPIEVVVNGQTAKDAAAIQEENNSLRNQLSTARADAIGECVEKIKRVEQQHLEAHEKLKGKAIGEMQKIRAEECAILAAALESLQKEGEG